MILNKYKETGQFPMKHFKESPKIESISPPLAQINSENNIEENAPYCLKNIDEE